MSAGSTVPPEHAPVGTLSGARELALPAHSSHDGQVFHSAMGTLPRKPGKRDWRRRQTSSKEASLASVIVRCERSDAPRALSQRHAAPNQPFGAHPIEAKLIENGIGPIDTVRVRSVMQHRQRVSGAGPAFDLFPVEKVGHGPVQAC